MNENAQLIETFYKAFQELDGETMSSCYHPDVSFSDPAFPDLKGEQAGGMWKMLCKQAQDFTLTYSDVSADESAGKAYWEAKYKFSVTGRSVHNKIHAEFEFKDGKIFRHQDTFDFYTWSKMALGVPGFLLGWTPFLKNKVQAQAAKNLSRFMQKT